MGVAIYFYLGLTVVVGAMVSLQGAANSQLARVLDNTLLAALISFAIGTLALLALVLVLVRPSGSPVNFCALSGVSPVLFVGGVLGAAYDQSAGAD